MSRVLMGLIFLASAVAAQQASAQVNTEAGKAAWSGGAIWCRNCHGDNGEGGLGPDLAGRKMSFEQFQRAVRQPWGIMPAFVDEWVTDQDLQNIMGYLDSLPRVAEPGKWRTPVAPGVTLGEELAIGFGCGQCHGADMGNTRLDIGGVDADFEWFKRQVYSHSTEMPAHRKLLGEANTTLRMGNYSRTRLTESTLQDIWKYTIGLGARAYMTATMSPAVKSESGMTYTLTVDNGGLPGKGLAAEDVSIVVGVAPGFTVASASGPGYQGVRRDDQFKGDAAFWRVPKVGPREKQTLTITFTGNGPGAPISRAEVRWAKPLSGGKADSINIGVPQPGGRGGRGAAN